MYQIKLKQEKHAIQITDVIPPRWNKRYCFTWCALFNANIVILYASILFSLPYFVLHTYDTLFQLSNSHFISAHAEPISSIKAKRM